MNISHIELENIGCFSGRTFEFSDLTVIFGENRTGKSTLVHALYFALFGKHLNNSLTPKDICRKGESSGRVALEFSQDRTDYRLCQFTDRLPELYRISELPERLQPVPLNDPEALKFLIPATPEIAALTSFFREGELIYFLQDMPRYNNTLLQSLIGMDDALILRSRFKKALAKATEYRRAIRNAAPGNLPDPLNLELAKRQFEEAEKAFADTDAEYRLAAAGEPVRDMAVFRLLERQRDEKKQQMEMLRELREKFPSMDDLARKKAELEKRINHPASQNGPSAEVLREQLGIWREKAEQTGSRLDKLARLEKMSACPVCGQDIPENRLAQMGSRLRADTDEAVKNQTEITETLKKMEIQEQEMAALRREFEETVHQMQQVEALEKQIADLNACLNGVAEDLKKFETPSGEVREAQARYSRRDELMARREKIQQEMVRHQVDIRRYQDIVKRLEENRAHLAEAERNVLICRVAHQAADEAIQAMGNRVLEQVRTGIRSWTSLFSFLDRFDIEIGDSELLPVIQAKGYQYKLNQMSKSERIFLYLLVKLALGDALGHLGFFVLDDPADGLDRKRKETLAYLLTEVSRKRRIIVTTNDAVFADLFPGSARVNI